MNDICNQDSGTPFSSRSTTGLRLDATSPCIAAVGGPSSAAAGAVYSYGLLLLLDEDEGSSINWTWADAAGI